MIEAHKVAVVGDTVMDPMKGVAWLGFIICIEIVCIATLLLLPLFTKKLGVRD